MVGVISLLGGYSIANGSVFIRRISDRLAYSQMSGFRAVKMLIRRRVFGRVSIVSPTSRPMIVNRMVRDNRLSSQTDLWYRPRIIRDTD
jgi:hypothetical protein